MRRVRFSNRPGVPYARPWACGTRAGLHSCVAAFLMVLASGLARQALGDEAQGLAAYSGTATDAHSGDFLYHESHWLRYRGGALAERVVLYTCKDGSPFARKTVSYVSPLTPDFQLEDESNGLRQGVRTQGGGRRVFFRADSASTEKSEALPPEPDLVADTGFDEFVRSRWRVLLDGQTVSMDFLVPSRLRSLEFKVQHLRSDQVDGVPVEVFHLKVAGVIGWVAPSIDVLLRRPGSGVDPIRRVVGPAQCVQGQLPGQHPFSAVRTKAHRRAGPRCSPTGSTDALPVNHRRGPGGF